MTRLTLIVLFAIVSVSGNAPPIQNCDSPSTSIDCALAHEHGKDKVVEGLWKKREHKETARGKKPDDWDESVKGPFIEGSPYILGNAFTIEASEEMSFHYSFAAADAPLIAQLESKMGTRVRVTYDPKCRLAKKVELIGPEPTPTPTPENCPPGRRKKGEC